MSRAEKYRWLLPCVYALTFVHVMFFAYSMIDGNGDLIFTAMVFGVASSIVGFVTSLFAAREIKKIILVSGNLCALAAYLSFAYYLFFIALPRALDGLPPG